MTQKQYRYKIDVQVYLLGKVLQKEDPKVLMVQGNAVAEGRSEGLDGAVGAPGGSSDCDGPGDLVFIIVATEFPWAMMG